LIGNLNHFVGAVLGHTDYIRRRDEEFTSKDIPKTQLLVLIIATQKMLEEVLTNLSPEQLEEEYPIELLNQKWQTGTLLIHLAAHLNYHLGQINYHRRLLENKV
jgi:uncharacterized damage-inducible protein DinB